MNPTDNTKNEFENSELTQNSLKSDTEVESEIQEAEDFIKETTASQKYKNRTLMVATGIFAVTAFSFGIWYSFFNNDISGVWETNVDMRESDGSTHTEVMKLSFDNAERMSFFENEKSYFSDKEANSLKVNMINGGMSFSGWYNTANTDSGDIVKMYLSAYQSVDSYKYESSGNIFTGKQLKLTSENEVIELKQSDKTYSIDPDSDFKPDTGVVGTWKYGEVSYTFTEEGRFINDTNAYQIDGVYNFGKSDDGHDTIIVKYKYNGDIVEVNLPYLVKGNTITLTINGYEFDFTKAEE